MAERKLIDTKAVAEVQVEDPDNPTPAELRAQRRRDAQIQRTGTTKIAVNQHAVIDLAVNGSLSRAEMFLTQTHRTMKRLGLKLGRNTKRYTPGSAAAAANMQGVIRWLDALSPNDDDCGILKRLHKTLVDRVSPEFLKSLEK